MHMEIVLHVHRVSLTNRIPTHEIRRTPPTGLRARVDDGILSVSRPDVGVGRIIHRVGHAIAIVSPRAHLRFVTLRRIGVMEIFKQVIIERRFRQDVVRGRSLEFNQAQLRFHPIHPVIGERFANHALGRLLIVLSFYDNLALFVAPRRPKHSGRITHAEFAHALIKDHPGQTHVRPFPRFVPFDHGIICKLQRRVQFPAGVLQCFNNSIIEEKLTLLADRVETCRHDIWS